MVAISGQVYSRVMPGSVVTCHRVLRQRLDPLGTQLAVHEQREQVRVAGERRAVRVVGRELDAPRVVGEQEQLQPRRPLHGVVEVGAAVTIRDDPEPLALAVRDGILARVGRVVRPELAQDVAGHRDRLAEHDLAHIDGEALVPVHRLGEPGRSGGELARPLRAVGVELQVREVEALALGRLDGGERGLHVARHAEVAAVQVQRVRHAELVHRALQRLDDRPRGHARARHLVVQPEARAFSRNAAAAPGLIVLIPSARVPASARPA